MPAPWKAHLKEDIFFMLDSVSIGARVKHHRTRNGISQEELAERIQISRVTISNIERGESTPSLETIVNIANALYTSADELLAGNLLVVSTGRIEEELDILYDCSQEESKLLLQNMRALKEIIRGYKISK